MPFAGANFCCGSKQRDKQCTKSGAEHSAHFHKRASIRTPGTLSRAIDGSVAAACGRRRVRRSESAATVSAIERWTLNAGRWTFSSMQFASNLFQQTSKVLTVSELTRSIRGTLEAKFGAVWVQGEISNYKLHPSGHQYFTLKDQRAQISCVIWRDTMQPPRQPLADGARVQVFGTVTVFEARGQYQLHVQFIQPSGLRLLQAKFEALKWQ